MWYFCKNLKFCFSSCKEWAKYDLWKFLSKWRKIWRKKQKKKFTKALTKVPRNPPTKDSKCRSDVEVVEIEMSTVITWNTMSELSSKLKHTRYKMWEVPINYVQNLRKCLELWKCTRVAIATFVCAGWMVFLVKINYFTIFTASLYICLQRKRALIAPYLAKIQLKLLKYALFVTFESK